MKRRIRKVAVIGSGTMGIGIACVCANAGIRSYLLDIVPRDLSEQEKNNPEARNRIALTNKANMLKARIPQIMDPADADLITCGNTEDNLDWLSECDWVVEVVPEVLSIKKDVLKKIAPFIKPGTIVSTNTSSISINKIGEDMPVEFQKKWLGTHFFNPVPFMKLLEIIPGKYTEPEVLQFMADFGERTLGKGIVWCKDTPGFVANRFGNWSGPKVLKLTRELGLTVSEVDAIMGPGIGRPRTGSFGLLDLVGMDIAVNATGEIKDNVTDPAEIEAYTLPDYILKLNEMGVLGNKTGGGFYKRIDKKERVMLDLDSIMTGELKYVPVKEANFPSLEKAMAAATLAEKMEAFFQGNDPAAKMVWEYSKGYLLYAASKIPEVSDDILGVDRAMRWGYNHPAGPFEQWNGLDLKKYINRMEAEGATIPAWLKEMVDMGFDSFYKNENGIEYYYSPQEKKYVEIKFAPEVIILPKLKADNKVIFSEPGGTLYDIGDGIVCFEIGTRNAVVNPVLMDAMKKAQEELNKNWEGMVISSASRHFSVGGDLVSTLAAAEAKEWAALDQSLRAVQDGFMANKYSPKPVVSAIYGRVLGGGCELAIQSTAIQAHAEVNIGLVECGVGLVPAGGGLKEIALRASETASKGIGSFIVDFLAPYFFNVIMARVSFNYKDARKIGYLRNTDGVSFSKDFLISDAKKKVLRLLEDGYQAPVSKPIPAPGKNNTASLKAYVLGNTYFGMASDYDYYIACRVMDVLSGGDVITGAMITEQYLLDLERELFVSLCGEPKTQERIKYNLQTKKILRN